MTGREALIWLNMNHVGSAGLEKIVSHFGAPEKALGASEEKLRDCGLGEKAARGLAHFVPDELDRELQRALRHSVSIVTLFDPDFPFNLKNIYDPPLALYVSGEFRPSDAFSIAIVGSRRATFYGLSNARELAIRMASHGFVVVSGMARGIDTYAHLGALKAQGRTIAFMGSGFGHVYPPENRKLAADIVSSGGCVVSEFPMGTPPERPNFPRRNRLISGMSLGVVVIEAGENSGALITADCAMEQGRDVFALPGKIDSLSSRGTNRLIREGAKLVSCVEDILEELPAPVQRPPLRARGRSGTGLLQSDDLRLYDIISEEGVSFDEMIERTGMPLPHLARVLLRLETGRLIRRAPGNRFLRN